MSTTRVLVKNEKPKLIDSFLGCFQVRKINYFERVDKIFADRHSFGRKIFRVNTSYIE